MTKKPNPEQPVIADPIPPSGGRWLQLPDGTLVPNPTPHEDADAPDETPVKEA